MRKMGREKKAFRVCADSLEAWKLRVAEWCGGGGSREFYRLMDEEGCYSGGRSVSRDEGFVTFEYLAVAVLVGGVFILVMQEGLGGKLLELAERLQEVLQRPDPSMVQ